MKRDIKSILKWAAIITVVGVLVEGLILGDIITPVYKISLYNIGINIILAVSLNLIIGITGQFSLGHAGFMAIGAFSVAITLQYLPGYPGFFVGLALGMIISALLSFVIAIPTLRLRGDYLAIATLGFSEIIRIVILNVPFTGGAAGIAGIERLLNWPLLFVFIVLSVLVVAMFKNSRFGRACISIREDEIASQAMGIPVTRYKVLAFTLGVVLASVAGSLYAIGFNFVSYNNFTFAKSIDVLVIVVFGGLGSITGTILSASVLEVINLLLQDITELKMIIYSITLILIMIFKPSGLLGSMELSLRKKPKVVEVSDDE